MILYTKCGVFLFKVVVDSGNIFEQGLQVLLYSFSMFFIRLSFVYPYFVDVVEAAPPGAAEGHWSCWDKQTRDHHSCCMCVWSSCECNSCEAFFLKCSSLERASRSLAKTGFMCLKGYPFTFARRQHSDY